MHWRMYHLRTNIFSISCVVFIWGGDNFVKSYVGASLPLTHHGEYCVVRSNNGGIIPFENVVLSHQNWHKKSESVTESFPFTWWEEVEKVC